MPRRWLSPDFFTDEKMKRATVPERLLGAAIIANQDDDGRLRGDPAYLRSIAFLYDDYSLDEVRDMRDHLAKINPNILIYQNDGDEYIQLKRYKRYQRPRYYHPSKFPAPPDWPFEEENNRPVTKQQPSSNHKVTKQQPEKPQATTLGEGEGKGKNLDLDLDKGRVRGKHPPPSPGTHLQIYDQFLECYEKGWGMKTGGRVIAQMRDFSKELSAAGCPIQYVREAFKEAADHNKLHISYVRKVLHAWLGLERGPPGSE